LHFSIIPLFIQQKTTRLLRKDSIWRRGFRSLPHPSFSEGLIFLIILVGAISLNLYRLGEPSMWFDEILSYERARQPLAIVWQIDITTQPNMALYYLVLHFWLRLTSFFGFLPTEWVLRLPSALFSALGALILYLLGKRFINRLAAIVTVSLYILNPLQLIYAQQTRSYSMELLLICVTTYLLLSRLECAKRQTHWQDWLWWCVYGILCAMMVYTHIFSILILFAYYIIICIFCILPTNWQKYARKSFLPLVFSQVEAFLLLIPLLPAARQGGKTGWLPIPKPYDMIHFFVTLVAGQTILLGVMLLVLLIGLTSVLFSPFWSAISNKMVWAKGVFWPQVGKQQQGEMPMAIDGKETKGFHNTFVRAITRKSSQPLALQTVLPISIVLFCLVAVPFFSSYIISQGPMRLFSARYLVAIVPPILLLVGLAVAALPLRILQLVSSLVLFLFACSAVPNYYRSAEVENWKQAVFWLEQQYQANDGITCYNNANGCDVCISYYLQAYPNGITFPKDSPGSFPWVNYDLTNQIPAGTDAAINPKDLRNYLTTHKRLFFIVGRLNDYDQVKRAQAAQHWLDTNAHIVDQLVTPTVSIRLYHWR
jgi:4-amino-4-deoxy-L-arabinose transferase-like glycosyltransferase